MQAAEKERQIFAPIDSDDILYLRRGDFNKTFLPRQPPPSVFSFRGGGGGVHGTANDPKRKIGNSVANKEEIKTESLLQTIFWNEKRLAESLDVKSILNSDISIEQDEIRVIQK
ncbi:hypothetical protein AVEN_118786-1 [Araneus ventricosus]|uniref:Uncharacterized protein n=1 Tax=Araneus ventricosus TaxID=182803 RepID=A0A4Y2BWE6_ARAVE|nr:hypothetical protein AVEN_118786-1 [Araneus ventricosus]